MVNVGYLLNHDWVWGNFNWLTLTLLHSVYSLKKSERRVRYGKYNLAHTVKTSFHFRTRGTNLGIWSSRQCCYLCMSIFHINRSFDSPCLIFITRIAFTSNLFTASFDGAFKSLCNVTQTGILNFFS